MNRIIFLLLIAIFVNTGLNAQQVGGKKKAPEDNSSSKEGFKKKSSVANKKSAPIPASAPIESQKTSAQLPTTTPNSATAKNSSKVLEMVSVDYKNMPSDVQSRINNNKSKGKYLFDGIEKVFLVEIKSCITDADRKRTLAFLEKKEGFIKSEFVSPGLVKIIVQPEFDSPDLKEVISAESIHFNFLNRSYLLKN